MGMGREREKDRELKLKMVTTHGSRGIPLVLLHPGLLRGTDPRTVLLGTPSLRIPSFWYPWGASRRCSHKLVGHVYEHFLPFPEFASQGIFVQIC